MRVFTNSYNELNAQRLRVFVNIYTLMKSNDSWNRGTLNYYFHPFVLELADPKTVDVIRAVDLHKAWSNLFKEWIKGRIANEFELSLPGTDDIKINEPVRSVQEIQSELPLNS